MSVRVRSCPFVVLVLLGFIPSVYALSPAPVDHDRILQEARDLIEVGEYETARERLIPYLNADPPRKDYAEYLLAVTTFSDPDPEAARRAVESFRRRYPDSPYAPTALFRLGQYYRVELRDPERAVAVYSQFLKTFSQDALAREVQMWLASALVDAGQYDRAIASIHQATSTYEYDANERAILAGLLDFAKQSSGQPSAGSVTIEVRPPPAKNIPTTTRPPAPNPAPPDDAEEIQTFESFPVPVGAPSGLVRRMEKPAEVPVSAPEKPIASEPYVIMDFRSVDINDILTIMTDDLGVTFKKDPSVQVRLTLVRQPRLTGRSMALTMLNEALKEKGFDLVHGADAYHVLPARSPLPPPPAPQPQAPRVSESVRMPVSPQSTDGEAAVQDDRQDEGGPAAEEPMDGRERDKWLKVYTLREASSAKLANFLNAIFEQEIRQSNRPGVRPILISPDRMSNRLIVLGPEAFQEAALSLIRKLDYKGFSDFHVEVIPLKHASAVDLAAKFRDIVDWEINSRADTETQKILVQADSRLNALVITSSSQSLLKTFADLTRALDQPTPLKQFLEAPKLKSLGNLQDLIAR
ncbi:tetratricopeptide repeat protein [bacterium]|nr:tetratricopeptide repeat protein [bacterium]